MMEEESEKKEIAVPQSEWVEFCKQFSRQHQGWLVTIRENYLSGLSQIIGETLLEDEELWGVTASTRKDEWEITIIAGEEPDHLVHLIHDPVRIFFERTEDGADRGLRVESADGLITELAFRTPAQPETLDGVSEAELLVMP